MDPFLGSAILGTVGGVAGYFGQQSANESNAALQEKANQANSQIAAENRSWQERMSNTAHQREIADLKLAGLNPILSATGGSGASTPSGNTAQMGAAKMEDAIGKGLSSAKDFASMPSALQNAQKDLAIKDSTITAQAAATAQSLSSAKKIDADTMGTLYDNSRKEMELPAAKSRYQLEQKQNSFDLKANDYDNIMKRAEQATGAIGNIMPGIKALKQIPSLFKGESKLDKLKREQKEIKDYVFKRN